MTGLSRREIGKLALAGAAWFGLSGQYVHKPLGVESLLENGFYATTDTQCFHWCVQNPRHPYQSAIFEHIATKPVARWVMEGDQTAMIDGYLRDALANKQLPVLVAYNIPNRDMGSHSAGGAANATAYAEWASRMAKAIGSRPCMVILEPDSIMHMAGKPAHQQAAQCAVLNHAIDFLAAYAPHAWIYADAGNGQWPSVDELAPLLARLRTDKLRGFALNVSNYNSDTQCAAQAAALMHAMAALQKPLKGWVFDSSRNGNGATHDGEWCNPAARKIGKTATRGHMGADANLWIKLPGESDGACGAYPNTHAGEFLPDIAHNLIQGI